MMSQKSYLTDGSTTDDGSHDMAHVMFYTALVKPTDGGANLPKSLIYQNPQFNGKPEPISVFFTLTVMRSDGTPAPVM